MLERTCFHIDKEEPANSKRGWHFQSFHFNVEGSPELANGIEIRACDLEHALKQAKAWGRKDGFTVIEQRR